MASLGPELGPGTRGSRGDKPKTGEREQRTRGEEPEPGDRAQRTRGPELETAQGDMRTRGPAPELGDRGQRTRGEEPGVPSCAPPSSPVPRSLLEPGWNLSFAGCGFRSVYYLGALSCLLERVPELVHGAARFSGASSGSLVAAALAVNVPLSVMVSELVAMALEARSLTGGVFSPTFSLQRRARDSLLKLLPLDAHVHASRRLCVSLTRVHDGKNLRVTSFRSREELVQVLLCSCFFPVYCGFIPPTYKGECYMDGALSDNQPLSELPNSVLFSPFSGESDICPKESGFSPVQICFGNVSIEVNTGNVHRVWTSFLPQSPQVLMQMCMNGYTDALRFLSDSGQEQSQNPQGRSLDSVKNRLKIYRRDEERGDKERADEEREPEESNVLPGDILQVLVLACSEPPPRPAHFSDPPVLHIVLGLVLDLLLVLIQLVLLPVKLLLNLSIRLLSLCSCRSSTSNLQKRPMSLDKNRNLMSTRGKKNCDNDSRSR